MKSLNEVVCALQDSNETILMDGELGFDAYSLSSCMWNLIIVGSTPTQEIKSNPLPEACNYVVHYASCIIFFPFLFSARCCHIQFLVAIDNGLVLSFSFFCLFILTVEHWLKKFPPPSLFFFSPFLLSFIIKWIYINGNFLAGDVYVSDFLLPSIWRGGQHCKIME